jgi:hypothetical protein
MTSVFNKEQNGSLLLGGSRTSGQEVRNQNGKLIQTHLFQFINTLI